MVSLSFFITDATFNPKLDGINATTKNATIGEPIWNDKDFIISDISNELEGAILFQSSYNLPRVNASITSNRNAEIFIASIERDCDDVMNALEGKGWTLRNEIYLVGTNRFGFAEKLDKVWTKNIKARESVPILLERNAGEWKLFMTSDDFIVAFLIKEGTF